VVVPGACVAANHERGFCCEAAPASQHRSAPPQFHSIWGMRRSCFLGLDQSKEGLTRGGRPLIFRERYRAFDGRLASWYGSAKGVILVQRGESAGMKLLSGGRYECE
jgi:hypothetical protein